MLVWACMWLNACTPSASNSPIAEGEEINQFLHVPSPAWEDQILYFIVTDRFEDGDTTNNDQGEGEYKKGNGGFWNGGDFRGITQRIDYIKELGATGIWITPPVANQWRNPQHTGTGNHGYWASNFVEVDKHYGTLADYQQLSASLHKNDMYLIQDVVCNHLGDFYTYIGPYNPEDVSENFQVNDVAQPTQYPFMHNDATKAEDREMAVYHFTPNFHDHSDTVKKRLYQFADLDDLNTDNPLVRETLRASYNHWIKEVGVDGFRFDTPHMVEHAFWKDFIHSEDQTTPGVEKFAQGLGKEQFFTFGETAVRTLPYDEAGFKEAAHYLGTPQQPEMTSFLNFPLFSTIQWVFKEQKPTHLLRYYFEQTHTRIPHPEYLLNFIDNHDGARFLSNGSHASFQQALLFIMTIPGIPVIYYGTEQELKGMRQSMFKGGVGSPDQDHFHTDTESFRFLQNLIRLRKEHALFRSGKLSVVKDAIGGPGVFAYRLELGEEAALVLFNTSSEEQFIPHIPTGFGAGSVLEASFSLGGKMDRFPVDEKGQIHVRLSPMAGMILFPGGQSTEQIKINSSIQIQPLENTLITEGMLAIQGRATGLEKIELMLDGALSRSQMVSVQADQTWAAQVAVHHLVNGTHQLTAFDPAQSKGEAMVSAQISFELNQSPVLCGSYQDKLGDDHGPTGSYLYPTHPSFTHQMDIEQVRVYRVGSNLQVEVGMKELTQIWLPPNGFDHVMVNIFIDLPGREGIKALPLMGAEMPGDAAWDYYVSTAGFGNALFSAEHASESQAGKHSGPAPFVSGDPTTKTITFRIAAEAIGYPDKLSGARIYVSTWDGGPGSPKGFNPEPGSWVMSGGNETDPKIMDDTGLITLRCDETP